MILISSLFLYIHTCIKLTVYRVLIYHARIFMPTTEFYSNNFYAIYNNLEIMINTSLYSGCTCPFRRIGKQCLGDYSK